MIIDQNSFLLGIITVVFIGGGLYYVKQRLGKEAVSLQGFKSKEQLAGYFKEAGSVIITRKWLILVPLAFYLGQYIVNLIFFILDIISNYGVQYLFNINGVGSFFKFAAFKQYIYEFITAPVNFSFISYGRLINNLFFSFFALGCVILFKPVVNKLGQYTAKESKGNLDLFERVLKYTLGLGVIITVTYLISYTLHFLANPGRLEIYNALSLVSNIAGVIIFSLLEAVILLTIKELIFKQDYNLEEKISKALSNFKALLQLNLLLAFIFHARYIIYSIFLIQNNLLGGVIDFVKLAVVITTIFMPQIIVFKKKNFKEALKENLNFLKSNFLKVIVLILLLSFTSFLFAGLGMSLNLKAFLYSHLNSGVFGLIKVVLSVVFSIVLTVFFLQVEKEDIRAI